MPTDVPRLGLFLSEHRHITTIMMAGMNKTSAALTPTATPTTSVKPADCVNIYCRYICINVCMCVAI